MCGCECDCNKNWPANFFFIFKSEILGVRDVPTGYLTVCYDIWRWYKCAYQLRLLLTLTFISMATASRKEKTKGFLRWKKDIISIRVNHHPRILKTAPRRRGLLATMRCLRRCGGDASAALIHLVCMAWNIYYLSGFIFEHLLLFWSLKSLSNCFIWSKDHAHS